MIRLRPTIRVFASGGRRWLESVVAERAVPLEDALHDVVKSLAAEPAASSGALLARFPGVDRGVLGGALAKLRELDLLAVDGAPDRGLWERLADGCPDVPVVDSIELTNVCPMSCAMCPTGSGRMTRDKGRMDRAVFAKVIDELAATGAQTKPLQLHNLGESLLHDELADFVRLATSRGIATELSANPGWLTFDLYRALEDAGLSRLVVSLDGVDAETLTAVRGRGAKAERAFAHVDAILAHRRATLRATPRLVLQMIRQRKNAHQHEAFLARYGALGIEGVAAYLKELDANTDESLVAIGVPGRPPRPYLCRAPWRTVVVLWDGRVVPCCHDANAAVVLGDVKEATLSEIWRGPAARRLRDDLAGGRPSAPCTTCAHRADRYAPSSLDDVPEEPLHW